MNLALFLESPAEDQNQIWEINCEGVLKHRLTDECCNCVDVDVETRHPVLWPFVSNHVSLYFNGRPESPLATIGRLALRHHELCGSWHQLYDFLNGLTEPMKLLDAGHGLFASGPEDLILEYKLILELEGLSCSVISRKPQIWNGHQRTEEVGQLYALILGTGFVVCRQIQAEPRGNMDQPIVVFE